MALSFDEMFPEEGSQAVPKTAPKPSKKALSFDEMFPEEGAKPVAQKEYSGVPLKSAQAQPWELGAVSRFQAPTRSAGRGQNMPRIGSENNPYPAESYSSAQDGDYVKAPDGSNLRKEIGTVESLVNLGGRTATAAFESFENIIPSMQVADASKRLGEIKQQGGEYVRGIFVPASKEKIAKLEAVQTQALGELGVNKILADKNREQYPVSADRAAFDQELRSEQGFLPSLSVMAKNPLDTAALVTESMGGALPAIGVAALTRNPYALAAIGGASNYSQEMAAGIAQYLDANGIPRDQWESLPQEVIDAAVKETQIRAEIIGGGGILLGGVASKALVPQSIASTPAKAALLNPLAQGAVGMVGDYGTESAAQVLSGQGYNPQESLLESMAGGIGQIGTSAQSTIEAARLRGQQFPNAPQVSPVPPQAAPEAQIAPEAALGTIGKAIEQAATQTATQAQDRNEQMASAGTAIDNRLSELKSATKTMLSREEATTLNEEMKDLQGLLAEQDKMKKDGVLLSPESRLTAGEIEQATQRVTEIKQRLEAHRAGRSADGQLKTLESRLSKIDNDNQLLELANSFNTMSPVVKDSLTTEQPQSLGDIGKAEQPEAQLPDAMALLGAIDELKSSVAGTDSADPLDVFLAGLEMPAPQAESTGALSPDTPKFSGQAPLKGRNDAINESGINKSARDFGKPTGRSDEINTELRAYIQEHGMLNANEQPIVPEDVAFEEVGADGLSDAVSELKDKLQKITGAEIVFLSDKNSKEKLPFDGVLSTKNKIYIAVDGKTPFTGIIGHEFVHKIKKEDPDLYDRLVKFIVDEDWKGHAKAYKYPDSMADDKKQEELVANAVADAVTDKGFLKTLADKAPDLFKDFAEAMVKHIDAIMKAFGRTRSQGSNQYIKDATAFRKELLEVLVEVAKRNQDRAKIQANKGANNDTRRADSQVSDQAGAGEIQNSRRVGRSSESVELNRGKEYSQSAESEQPSTLAGLPRQVIVDGRTVEFGGFKTAQDAAKRYMEQAGLEYNPPTRYAQVDPERAQAIADEFSAMAHNPSDPQVKRAYAAMIEETLSQYQAILDTGLKVEFIKGEDPYGNPRNAIIDIVENNHFWVFPTDDGFGSSNLDVSDNPLLAETEFTISGKPALANDIFRVVHDYFGHAKEGVGFRAAGEENAWRSHSAMYSPLARRAMTTETRGQNSWVNYGEFGEQNRKASPADTVYADQKVGLLPEWVSEDGAQFSRKKGTMSNEKETSNTDEQSGVSRPVQSKAGKVPKQQKLPALENAEVIPAFNQRTPHKEAVQAYGVHFSPVTGIKKLKGSKAGSGSAGAERRRFGAGNYGAQAEAGDTARRLYFYVQDEKSVPKKENAVQGNNRYVTRLDNLYDHSQDPLGLWSDAKPNTDLYEENVNAAGFDGILFPDIGQGISSRTAVVFGLNDDVPVISFSLRRNSIGNTISDDPKDVERFNRWFGNSAAVDEQGNPKVLYHGSSQAFDKFKVADQYYLTDDPKIANEYAETLGDNPNVMPLYASLQNPYEFDAGNENWANISPLRVSDLNVRVNERDNTVALFDIADAAFEAGYDSVIVKRVRDGNGKYGWVTPATVYIASRPNQMKSATGNNGQYNPKDDRLTFSLRKPVKDSNDWTFSPLARMVDGAPLKQVSADQWKKWIAANATKMGVKADELEYTGINEWLDLQQGKVAKEAIAEYLDAGGVRVEEVLKREEAEVDEDAIADYIERFVGDESSGIEDGSVYRYENGVIDVMEGEDVIHSGDPSQVAEELNLDPEDIGADRELTKFGEYRPDGGTNYRELLLTLPNRIVNYGEQESALRAKLDDDLTEDKRDEIYDQIDAIAKKRNAQGKKPSFTSSHWDEKNILAHIRFDTRKDADGNDVLFINEIQSDWAQDGRKKGFKTGESTRRAVKAERKSGFWEVTDQDGNFITNVMDYALPDADEAKAIEVANARLQAQEVGTVAQDNRPPTAPFVTDTKAWVALAIKRMVRYAVDNDIERIAFINGEQAADLYDLSKQINKASAKANDDGTYQLVVEDKNGQEIAPYSRSGKQVNSNEMENTVGKELARKLIEGADASKGKPWPKGVRENPAFFVVSGLDLKVGGEGMKSFYDKLVPQVANEVLKKLGGGKVSDAYIKTKEPYQSGGVIELEKVGDKWRLQGTGPLYDTYELADDARYRVYEAESKGATKQKVMVIPQAMRDKVAAGDVPLFARRQPVGFKDGKWQGLEATKNDLVEDFQDRMVSWKKIQNQIEKSNSIPIEDAANVYRLENLMHGKVSDNIKKLERSFYAPISKEIDRLGLTADDVQLYMIARHAPERNASIAQINPNMPDGGSGVNTAEAEAYMAAIPQEKRGKLDAIARRIDALVEDTRKRMLESGMIDQAQYNGLKKWKYYAPLRGKQGAETFGAFGAKGVDVRGKLVRNAMGRGSGNGAENVLGEIIGDSIKSVIAAERATVGRAVLRLVSQNPSPLWQIDPVQTERYINSAGEVAERTMSNMNDPAVLVVKHKGKAYSVKINDDRLVQAIKAMDSSQLADGLKYFAMLNRYFSAVLTQYNPAFVPVNAIRDFTFGLSGLAAEHGAVIAANASAHYPQAARAAYRHSTGKAPIGKMGQYADEFAEAGGQTGYMNMDTVEELQQKIKSGSFGSFNPKGVAASLRGMADFVSDVNSAVENALRLSAYAALRDSGMTADAAAEYAKNLTVNFNRKGRYGANLNAIILFFNAAMQGATRAGQLVRNPKLLVGLGALAGLQALLAMYAMGIDDDETGEPLWNTIPDYVKRRNLVIPTASGKVYYLPLQYGFNVFPYMAGRTVDALTQEDDRPQDSAANLVGDFSAALLESFFPVPLDEGAMGVIPHFIKPFIEIERNKDGLGRRIRDEPMSSEYPVPRSTLGRPDTPEAYKGIAKGLNRMAGGTDYVAPARPFDWAPEDIEHLLKTFTGGAGQFVMDSARLGEKVWSGLDVTPRDIPILKRFMSQTEPSATSASLFYDRREEIGRKDDQLRDILKRDGAEAAREFFDNSKEFTGAKMTIKGDELTLKVAKEDSVFGLYKAAQKAAKAHRELVREQYEAAPPSLIPNAKTAERSRLIRESELERAKVMSEFNRAWREASAE